MKAKFRMSVKLTAGERRTLQRLSKKCGCTMTDILVRGIGYVESAERLASLTGMDDVMDTRVLETIPPKGAEA